MPDNLDTMVDQIADAVVRKLEEREKITAIAREVLTMLEGRWLQQQRVSQGSGSLGAADAVTGGDAAVQHADDPRRAPPDIVAPAAGACDCYTASTQRFCMPEMSQGNGDAAGVPRAMMPESAIGAGPDVQRIEQDAMGRLAAAHLNGRQEERPSRHGLNTSPAD